MTMCRDMSITAAVDQLPATGMPQLFTKQEDMEHADCNDTDRDPTSQQRLHQHAPVVSGPTSTMLMRPWMHWHPFFSGAWSACSQPPSASAICEQQKEKTSTLDCKRTDRGQQHHSI
jgi:hypothetical protein